jgi:hypothetical protein
MQLQTEGPANFWLHIILPLKWNVFHVVAFIYFNNNQDGDRLLYQLFRFGTQHSILYNTLSVYNIRNTILILSCTLKVLWAWNTWCQVFHRDAGPCWLQYFPQLSSWLDVLWVVDRSWYTRETVERGKPSSVAVLDTLKALKYFVLPIHPLNRIHAQPMSQGLNIFFNLSHPNHLHWSLFNRFLMFSTVSV